MFLMRTIMAGPSRRFAKAQRLRNFALDAGLYAYFCLSCLLIGGCAVGFYKLMQPGLYPNSGAVAYTPTDLPPPNGASAFASVIKPEGKPAGAVTQDESEVKKAQHDTPATEAGRKRVAKRRDPMMAYAAQPPFGDYRSWGGFQNGNGNRRSGNYQAPTGYQSWGSYQGWSGYRNGH